MKNESPSKNSHYLLIHRDKYGTPRPEEKRNILDIQPVYFKNKKDSSILESLHMSYIFGALAIVAGIYFYTNHTNEQARSALKTLDDRISSNSSINLPKTNIYYKSNQK